VSSVQEEVHRFTVDYHRQKRKTSTLSGRLTEIPGVGKARAKALLTHFKSIKAIKEATVEELAAVKGLNKKTAENIFEAMKND
jgi:excinuclease ABC subunit C